MIFCFMLSVLEMHFLYSDYRTATVVLFMGLVWVTGFGAVLQMQFLRTLVYFLLIQNTKRQR